MEVETGGVRIECIVGDIADQPDVDAVVNAANAELRTGGGVAGALGLPSTPLWSERKGCPASGIFGSFSLTPMHSGHTCGCWRTMLNGIDDGLCPQLPMDGPG